MFVQIVNFKLKPDSSRELFLRLTEDMVRWLKQQPGFVAYELHQGTEGWADRIAWDSEAHAMAGLDAFVATPMAQQLIALVERDYNSFFGQVVINSDVISN